MSKEKCPCCGGKSVLLKKQHIYTAKRDSLEFVRECQMSRCKRCGLEFEKK